MQAVYFCYFTPRTLRVKQHSANRVRAQIRAAAISISKSGNHGLIRRRMEEENVAFNDYQCLFSSQREETDEPVALRVVEGVIPTDFPSGTYYLAGPGIFADDHGSTVHPLDGHGYLRAFTICATTGDVKYSARYVRTEALVEENDQKTGQWKFTYRGPFSVLKCGKKVGNFKVMKNVANTSVLKWGERLMCLWEGGVPYEIEPDRLHTIGTIDVLDCCNLKEKKEKKIACAWDVASCLLRSILHGVLKMPQKRILSHFKIDTKRKRLIMVSCNTEDMLSPSSNFTFYEYDTKFKLLQMREFRINDHLLIHDWAFTEYHYIIFANRVKLDITGSIAAISGFSPIISSLSVNPSKPTSPIYLLPRFLSESVCKRNWSIPIEAPSQLWLLHVGNGFENMIENDNGNVEIQIHASACSYRWLNFQKMFGYNWKKGKLDPSIMNAEESQKELLPHLVKVSINLDANGNCRNSLVEPLNQWNNPSDFPIINPAFSGVKSSYIYASTTSCSCTKLPHFPFDSIIKLKNTNYVVSMWFAGNRRFVGEPIFVPTGPKEDDGYLLVVEYAVSIQRCYLVVLNPKWIGRSDALVARIEIPRHLNFPMGFHGFWAPNSP